MKNMKSSEEQPSIQKVKLVESNRDNAHVKLENGRDVTVKVENSITTRRYG